jgi:UDP-galactopyranose mutase
MKYDAIVVGAGLAGITCANLLARDGKRVLILEKRSHLGGNLFDYYNEHGILIHKYGPHIFRTSDKKVWEFLKQYTEWLPYQHKVLANVHGTEVPFPINLDTYNQIFHTSYSSSEFASILDGLGEDISNPANMEEAVIAQIGRQLYELFYHGYSLKQWGREPRDLSAETVARIKVKTSRDDRYFEHQYQGLPLYGYTKMLENMLSLKEIHLMLNVDYKDVIDELDYDFLVYTGPLDYYFDYDLGCLDYRALRFEEKTFDQESYQNAAVVNYPNTHEFTRITEYKKLTGQKSQKTTVHFEYSSDCLPGQEPYYPVLNRENLSLKQKYWERVEKAQNLWFVGRLAEYRYYGMDDLLSHILENQNRLDY